MNTRNMREDELVAFGSAEEFERYENDDIQDKFDEDGEIESGSDWCDGGCSNDEGDGDACHEDMLVMEMVVMTGIMEMALMKVQVVVHQLEQYAGRVSPVICSMFTSPEEGAAKTAA